MIRFPIALLLLLVPPQDASDAERRAFVDKKVDPAIEKGLRALREFQAVSGGFSSMSGDHPHGTTALALYTLLALGGTLEDPAAAKALDWILKNPIGWLGGGSHDTYEISLIAVALSYALPHLPKGERREQAESMLQRAADWLVSAQVRGGGWSYSSNATPRHDHSNSQFAVLGLRAAANAGAKVKKEVWERELTHYKISQLPDGGWGYTTCYGSQARSRFGRSTATMTAAGVMGLAMSIGSTKGTRTEQLASDPAIKKGLEAMSVHWSRGLETGLKSLGGVSYLLYSIERACMLTGQRLIGTIDWYVEGAWLLITGQRADGFLGLGREPVSSHCFSLLFLKRAFIPVATPSNTKPRPPASEPVGRDSDAGKPREME